MSSYVQAQLHVDISDLVDLPNQPSKNRACFPRHDDITQKRNVTQCEKGEISLRAEGDAVSVGVVNTGTSMVVTAKHHNFSEELYCKDFPKGQ